MAYPMATKVSKTPPRSPTSNLGSAAGGGSKSTNNGSWLKGLVTLIVVLVIIGGGLYLIASYTGIGGGILSRGTAFKNDWQAVFLTNGQVYFGEVVKMDEKSVILQNIYYLQVVTQPLQRSQEGEPPQEPQQRLTLIKLGNELHGPRDEMTINRDHVILIEDLKDDGRVVQAINDYISQSGQ